MSRAPVATNNKITSIVVISTNQFTLGVMPGSLAIRSSVSQGFLNKRAQGLLPD